MYAPPHTHTQLCVPAHVPFGIRLQVVTLLRCRGAPHYLRPLGENRMQRLRPSMLIQLTPRALF